MTTLALEFSSRHRSAAVLVPAAGGSPARCGVAAETARRETPAFSLIQTALDAARIDRATVTQVVVGLGPGSSMGIRTAIAIARGWELARTVTVEGRSSLEALAWGLHAAGRRGRMHLVVDAQRREYHALTVVLAANGPQVTTSLRLAPVAVVAGWIEAGDTVLGPGVAAGVPGSEDAWPEARFLTRGVAVTPKEVWATGESLEPIHLRGITFVKTTRVQTATDVAPTG